MRLYVMMTVGLAIAMEEMEEEPAKMASSEQIKSELLKYRSQVFFLCLGFSKNYADAQDLTQETYLKAFSHMPIKIDCDGLKAWILRIARNTCLDRVRRQKIRLFFMPWLATESLDEESPEQNTARNEEIVLVKKAIQSLSQKLKEVLILKEYSDLSYKEIAQVLKIDQGTVMSRLSRARNAVVLFFKENKHGRK